MNKENSVSRRVGFILAEGGLAITLILLGSYLEADPLIWVGGVIVIHMMGRQMVTHGRAISGHESWGED